MIKKHWKLLLITSLIILLPIAVGVVFWDELPEEIPTTWNTEGEVVGWSSRAFGVFGMPAILLGFQWLCMLGTLSDPKRKNHSAKVLQMILWFIPVLSCLLCTLTYAAALGKEVKMEMVMPVFVGLVLAIVGNYLPKCKQNYTIGIKIPWTLNSEENWNRTHRFASGIWVVGGLVIMATGFFGGFWIFAGVVAVMVLAPMLYSYILYRKGI